TWYGMPAYAKDGNVVCFFQSAQKFKTRYATLGFSDKANLDEGHMWPTALRAKGAERRRRGKDRRAREESGELRLGRHWTQPNAGSSVGMRRSGLREHAPSCASESQLDLHSMVRPQFRSAGRRIRRRS